MPRAQDGFGQHTVQAILAALAVAAVILAALGYFDRIAKRWAGGPSGIQELLPLPRPVPSPEEPGPDACGQPHCVPTS